MCHRAPGAIFRVSIAIACARRVFYGFRVVRQPSAFAARWRVLSAPSPSRGERFKIRPAVSEFSLLLYFFVSFARPKTLVRPSNTIFGRVKLVCFLSYAWAPSSGSASVTGHVGVNTNRHTRSRKAQNIFFKNAPVRRAFYYLRSLLRNARNTDLPAREIMIIIIILYTYPIRNNIIVITVSEMESVFPCRENGMCGACVCVAREVRLANTVLVLNTSCILDRIGPNHLVSRVDGEQICNFFFHSANHPRRVVSNRNRYSVDRGHARRTFGVLDGRGRRVTPTPEIGDRGGSRTLRTSLRFSTFPDSNWPSSGPLGRFALRFGYNINVFGHE